MDKAMVFPTYESYRVSSFDWLGDIPSDWKLQRLATVFEERKEKVSDKDFPPLSVTKNGVVPQLDSAAKSDDGDNRKGVREGDFVINSRSDRKASSGIAKQDGSVSLINIVLRPKGITPRYSEHLLKSNGFIEEFYRNGHGIVADLWTTRYWDMKSIHIPLPDIATQERIANFLDQKTAEIDEAIAKKQRLIELLKEQKAILINQAVTKGLNPDVLMRDSGVEWIGEVPEHWNGKRAKFLFTQSRLPVQRKDDVITAYRDGQVTLRSNRRTEGYTIAILEQGYQGIRKGQLVLNSMDAFAGAIGVSDSDGKCSPEYVICDPIDQNEVVPMYYALLLREMALSGYIEVISSAVRQRAMRIRFSNLSSLLLPVPSFKEQTEIVEKVSALKGEIDSVMDALDHEIEIIKEYRAILIANAVTGKIKL